MLIWREKQQLDEMSTRVIANQDDKLPFKIVVKCPDEGRFDHAHILKLRTKADELGAFVITKNPPKSTSDLVSYDEGDHKGLDNLTNEQLQALVSWAPRRSPTCPTATNWQILQYEWTVNRNS
jgi:hypothetical protein